jgi:hypothetical protein
MTDLKYDEMTTEELHNECTKRRIWFYYKKIDRATFRRKLLKMLKAHDADREEEK